MSLPGPLSFVIMATIWGLTWIAIKTGVSAVPPFAFAGLRLVAAGAFLLTLDRLRGGTGAPPGTWSRVLVTAVLVNTVSYGFLFWGMQFVPSGLSSVVNLALIPVGLFTIGLVAKEETFSVRTALAIGIGIVGLVILFLPKLTFDGETRTLEGMAALVIGTLTYCLGSILSRPMLRTSGPLSLSGWLTFVGGIGLLVLAAGFEPVGTQTLIAFLEIEVLASWLFLVVGGSVIAFTLYLQLLRDWGPTRAGLYAFVSPIIAVGVGVFIMNERFGRYEIAGSALMLGAAGLAMRRKPASSP